MDSPLMSFSFRYSAGNRALNSGDNSGAVAAYKDAVSVWEKSDKDAIPGQIIAMCLSNLGIAYTRLGQVNDAIESFDRSFEVHPSYLAGLYNKAWQLEKVKKYREAIEVWESYLKLAETGHEEQSAIIEAKRRLSLAKTEFISQSWENKSSLKLEAGELYRLGLASQAEGKLEEAITEYREVLKINPNDFPSHTQLGLVYHAQGKLDEAVNEYQTVLRYINYEVAHFYLGNVYFEQGKLIEAIKEYREVLKMKPYSDDALYNLALTLEKMSQNEDALNEWKIYVKLFQEIPSLKEKVLNAHKHIMNLEGK